MEVVSGVGSEPLTVGLSLGEFTGLCRCSRHNVAGSVALGRFLSIGFSRVIGLQLISEVMAPIVGLKYRKGVLLTVVGDSNLHSCMRNSPSHDTSP